LKESSYSNKTLANRAGIVGGVARDHCLRGCDSCTFGRHAPVSPLKSTSDVHLLLSPSFSLSLEREGEGEKRERERERENVFVQQATREQLTKVRVARLHPHARRLFVVIVERAQKLDLDPRGFVEPTRIGYKEPRVVRVWRPVESQRDLARRGCGHVATSSLRRNDPDQVRRVCVLSLRRHPGSQRRQVN